MITVECVQCLNVVPNQKHRQRHPMQVELTEFNRDLWTPIVLAFHSNHEGHPLRILEDNKQIYPKE